MVVYLAVVDLLISLEHPIDHIYEVFQIEPGFEVFCTISAFLLQVASQCDCLEQGKQCVCVCTCVCVCAYLCVVLEDVKLSRMSLWGKNCNFREASLLPWFSSQLFVSAQSILVSIIAVSAFVAIARNRRIGFGRYDWALLAAVTAPPVAAGTVMLALDWLGPSGWW